MYAYVHLFRVNTAAKGNLLRFDLMKNSIVLNSLSRFINTQILVDEPVLIFMFILNYGKSMVSLDLNLKPDLIQKPDLIHLQF